MGKCLSGCDCGRHSERSRNAVRDRNNRLWADPEFRKQMSEAHKGQIASDETKALLSAQRIGHTVSEEARAKISLSNRGTYRGSSTDGVSLDAYGYRLLTSQHEHPLSKNGKLLEHRKVLYDRIGEGPHPCHWGCGRVLYWQTTIRAVLLCTDHLDDDKLNSDPENLVPSCFQCNWDRNNPKKGGQDGYRP